MVDRPSPAAQPKSGEAGTGLLPDVAFLASSGYQRTCLPIAIKPKFPSTEVIHNINWIGSRSLMHTIQVRMKDWYSSRATTNYREATTVLYCVVEYCEKI
jgi:hypothetical protein